MPRPDKIGAPGIIVGEITNRRGAVFGRNPGCGAVAIVDRHGKGGAVNRVVIGDHRRQMEPLSDVPGQRRADDAASVADDKGQLLGCGVHRGNDQVALILAVIIIGHDNDLAGGKCVDCLADTGLRQFTLSQTPRGQEKPLAARNLGLARRSLAIVNRHNIARACAARSGELSRPPMRSSRANRRNSTAELPGSAPNSAPSSAAINSTHAGAVASRSAIAMQLATRRASS